MLKGGIIIRMTTGFSAPKPRTSTIVMYFLAIGAFGAMLAFSALFAYAHWLFAIFCLIVYFLCAVGCCKACDSRNRAGDNEQTMRKRSARVDARSILSVPQRATAPARGSRLHKSKTC